MTVSPQKPLNGQKGGGRISEFKVQIWSWNVESICGRRTEVYKVLNERKVDVCLIRKVRWIGHGTLFLGVDERRYNFKLH